MTGNRARTRFETGYPQYAAGRLRDARVWVPNAKGTVPDATAAAEHAAEPLVYGQCYEGFLQVKDRKKQIL